MIVDKLCVLDYFMYCLKFLLQIFVHLFIMLIWRQVVARTPDWESLEVGRF